MTRPVSAPSSRVTTGGSIVRVIALAAGLAAVGGATALIRCKRATLPINGNPAEVMGAPGSATTGLPTARPSGDSKETLTEKLARVFPPHRPFTPDEHPVLVESDDGLLELSSDFVSEGLLSVDQRLSINSKLQQLLRGWQQLELKNRVIDSSSDDSVVFRVVPPTDADYRRLTTDYSDFCDSLTAIDPAYAELIGPLVGFVKNRAEKKFVVEVEGDKEVSITFSVNGRGGTESTNQSRPLSWRFRHLVEFDDKG